MVRFILLSLILCLFGTVFQGVNFFSTYNVQCTCLYGPTQIINNPSLFILRTNAETTFSNEYFRLLVEERWSPKLTHNGKPWTGPDQFEDSTGKLMMLPSDIVLIKDPELKKYVDMYAKNEDLFFKDFATAFAKLLALGVPGGSAGKPWYQFW